MSTTKTVYRILFNTIFNKRIGFVISALNARFVHFFPNSVKGNFSNLGCCGPSILIPKSLGACIESVKLFNDVIDVPLLVLELAVLSFEFFGNIEVEVAVESCNCSSLMLLLVCFSIDIPEDATDSTLGFSFYDDVKYFNNPFLFSII